MFTYTHAANYQKYKSNYALGEDYFNTVKPSYVVVGWFALFSGIYDINYLSQHADLLATFGSRE